MIHTILLIVLLQAVVITIAGCSQTAPDSVKAGQLVCQPKDSELCVGWKYDI